MCAGPLLLRPRRHIAVRALRAITARVARRVTLHAQHSVIRVLERVSGIDSLVTRYDKVPVENYDVAIRLSELPYVFRTSIETIPAQIPYVHIAPRSLPATSNINVGLVWQDSDWDPRRFVPLELFAGFEHIAGLTLHIMQRAAHYCSGQSGLVSIQETTICT